jgi:hypothetical protein
LTGFFDGLFAGDFPGLLLTLLLPPLLTGGFLTILAAAFAGAGLALLAGDFFAAGFAADFTTEPALLLPAFSLAGTFGFALPDVFDAGRVATATALPGALRAGTLGAAALAAVFGLVLDAADFFVAIFNVPACSSFRK